MRQYQNPYQIRLWILLLTAYRFGWWPHRYVCVGAKAYALLLMLIQKSRYTKYPCTDVIVFAVISASTFWDWFNNSKIYGVIVIIFNTYYNISSSIPINKLTNGNISVITRIKYNSPILVISSWLTSLPICQVRSHNSSNIFYKL